MLTGGVFLYLSAEAATGSWAQSTLDAFGVGLVVGGIVDVVAITLLDQFFTSSRQHWNATAEELLASAWRASTPKPDDSGIDITVTHLTPEDIERNAEMSRRAQRLLDMHGATIAPTLRRSLEQLADGRGMTRPAGSSW
jgi:hypothetical protein